MNQQEIINKLQNIENTIWDNNFDNMTVEEVANLCCHIADEISFLREKINNE
ncbi:MAG: hypothetical protein BAJALOKI1v1_2530007 [Promethearchaeota archaeon]|nr:MAG: hypothetical protein BAJALOKI1v1_2530007 [Candidatus Lokiarchaeota archaeon]